MNQPRFLERAAMSRADACRDRITSGQAPVNGLSGAIASIAGAPDASRQAEIISRARQAEYSLNVLQYNRLMGAIT